MTGSKDEGGRTAEQVQKDLLADGTTQTAATASGLAALGSPSGEETAKDTEHNSGIEPDAIQAGKGPIGLQKEAAFFTKNGSIPGNSVPSPTGPVPASTIADEATRNAAVEQARAGATRAKQGRNSRFRLSDEYAAQVSPATLRAVANDRGYEGVEGGRQSVLQKFLAAQKKDESLEDPPEDHPFAAKSTATAPVAVNPAVATGNPLTTPSTPGGLKTTDGKPVSSTPTPAAEAKK